MEKICLGAAIENLPEAETEEAIAESDGVAVRFITHEVGISDEPKSSEIHCHGVTSPNRSRIHKVPFFSVAGRDKFIRQEIGSLIT